MTLDEFKNVLVRHGDKNFKMLLPGGDEVPMCFHITEVGHVAKRFIDCGGTTHRVDTCQLQAWVGDDENHRLQARKLLGILDKAIMAVLPDGANQMEVEMEYEDCALSQYPIEGYEVADDAVVLRLSSKHTDCLAKEICLAPTASNGAGANCCGGKC